MLTARWCKMRPSLVKHDKVIQMESLLANEPEFLRWMGTEEARRFAIVTGLLLTWGEANARTTEGFFPELEPRNLDVYSGVPCFGEAMYVAEWAKVEEGGVRLPNFLEWNVPEPGKKARGGQPGNQNASKNESKRIENESSTSTSVLIPRGGEESANGGGAAAEYLAMLENWGGLRDEQMAKAEAMILRQKPTAEDVAAWRRCFALASTREDIDAMSYCRNRATCETHPSRAGIPWWNAAERERKTAERKMAPSVKVEISPPPQDLGAQLKAMKKEARA